MDKVNPSIIKFIKLGRSGDWESRCLESEKPMIRLGFDNPHHQKCLDGDWEFIKNYWSETKTKGKSTETTKNIKDFYTHPSLAMWITFYKRKLYWCFAKTDVTLLDDGSRVRNVIGKWSSQDINGEELYVENLSGKLAKVQMFRGTMCKVKEADYLINKINAETLPEISNAKQCLKNLISSIEPLISNLGWQDFELLVDLIFSNAGWQRVATLGKVEKSIDLDVISPVTGKRAFIQVKSRSTKIEFEDYIEQFLSMKQYDEMYYISHTDTSDLEKIELPNNIQLIGLKHMAKLTVNSGLVPWLITKAS